ncbi:hypothetical protein B9Z55_015696 [Caenorhabditis nigoni]|uniref:SET domain-containing protein n=1 Tax=Caenorhabditis nigoni TaxID=1611254 RepID=A0A2G5UBZ5_9PELO|nr:hypothetical protein B9Z55_015696 [Caenorhabditis nigoni]
MNSSFLTKEKSSFPILSYKFERKSTRKAVKPICIRSKLVYGYDGNSARFANHNYDANMIAKKWMVSSRKEGFKAIGFVANKNIRKGAELTINYDYNP